MNPPTDHNQELDANVRELMLNWSTIAKLSQRKELFDRIWPKLTDQQKQWLETVTSINHFDDMHALCVLHQLFDAEAAGP